MSSTLQLTLAVKAIVTMTVKVGNGIRILLNAKGSFLTLIKSSELCPSQTIKTASVCGSSWKPLNASTGESLKIIEPLDVLFRKDP